MSHLSGLKSVIAYIFFSAWALGCGSSNQVADERARMLAQQSSEQAQQTASLINEGDQIQITVPSYPEFNTTTYVKASGAITVPLVGEVQAQGLLKEQLADQISRKLSEYVKTKVYPSITIVTASMQRIIVFGAVLTQGSLPLTTPTPIFQVLANAGGTSTDADLRNIRIYRGGDLNRVVDVDLSGLLSPVGVQKGNIPSIYPGDMIYIPRAENFVRQFGPFLYDIVLLLTLFALI